MFASGTMPSRRYLPPIVFAIVTVLGFAISGYAWFASDRANRLKFEAVADDALARIAARIELHLSLLHATHAYFAARRGEVDRDAFSTFVKRLETESRYGGIQGIGFAALMRSGSDEAAADWVLENYNVRREIWPATDQDWRTPIVLLEPLDLRNASAIAYDMFSEPTRRTAMIQAVEYAMPQASAPVELVQEISSEKQLGFLVYVPFIKPSRAPADGSLSLNDVAGFVYAPFRVGDLFTVALARSPTLPVHVEAYDETIAPGKLIFASQPLPAAGTAISQVVDRQISVAGRIWHLRFHPTADFDPSFSSLVSLMLGIVTLLLAAALAVSASSQNKALDAAAALHEAAERNLAEREMMLQEMKHRIKNSIARILAIARQSSTAASSVQEFMDSFSARLQAMATSQDMLTRSKWQRADLRELLVMELKQVFGDDIDKATIAGEPVELSESQTQALGLTFHELATNALKYGAVSTEGAGLQVRWSIDRQDGRNRLLDVRWQEEGGAGIVAPTSVGFGTRLIDATITHELGGTISRDYRHDGLRIAIRIPLARPATA